MNLARSDQRKRGRERKRLVLLNSSLRYTYKILVESNQPRLPMVVKYQDCFNHIWTLDLSNRTEIVKLLTAQPDWTPLASMLSPICCRKPYRNNTSGCARIMSYRLLTNVLFSVPVGSLSLLLRNNIWVVIRSALYIEIDSVFKNPNAQAVQIH